MYQDNGDGLLLPLGTARRAGRGGFSSSSAVTLLVLAAVVTGAGGQGPLTCWTCTATSQDSECYDLHPENKAFTSTCNPEDVYCTVNRIWYVVEVTDEARNFSVNRTCAPTCRPSCVVIGDRTKIHSCTSCCTESLCNMGNTAPPTHQGRAPLLLTIMPGLLIGRTLLHAAWTHSLLGDWTLTSIR